MINFGMAFSFIYDFYLSGVAVCDVGFEDAEWAFVKESVYAPYNRSGKILIIKED